MEAIHILHSDDENRVAEALKIFLDKHISTGEKTELFLSGENGDNRLLKYYTACEAVINDDITIARFKHMTGEYPTASAVAAWIACHILQHQHLPEHMIKKPSSATRYKKILIYNNYKGYSIVLYCWEKYKIRSRKYEFRTDLSFKFVLRISHFVLAVQ